MYYLNNIYFLVVIFSYFEINAHFTAKTSYNNNFNPLPSHYIPHEKDVTVILYMAADNDLRSFVYRNLEEIKYLLRATDATNNFNIFIHLDVHNPGQKKMTFHLVAYQKELCLAWQGEMDSGKEETLVYTYTEALKYCPGKKIILGLWNHGTGDLNPTIGKIFNSSNLYEFDPIHQKIILDRSIGFLDYIENICLSDDRGICFDDSTHNYLTNQKVGNALARICTEYRNGKKLDLIFCDACLMAGVGFIQEITPWADYFIASEEVVLATGFRYDQVLNFLNQPNQSIETFIKHTVKTFENTYQKLTPDYTLSGINLKNIENFYITLDLIAETLIVALRNQKDKTVKDFIKKSSWRGNCTSFDEPSYKDVKHLFSNFLLNINMITLTDKNLESLVKSELKRSIERALTEINTHVIAHCAGKNLLSSGGMSIYLPESRLHPSFQYTTFGQKSAWLTLLILYLAA